MTLAKNDLRQTLAVDHLAASLLATYSDYDRDTVCRALSKVIGGMIARDPTTINSRIITADLYGMHIRAAVRPHARGSESINGWGR